MNVEKVGHVGLRVSDLERAVSFHCGVSGLTDVARADFGHGAMAFLSTGNSHHDLALVETPELGQRRASRVHHLALKLGGEVAQLVEVKAQLESLGAPVQATIDHGLSRSVYTSDPDGNLIELYIDVPGEAWRGDPSLVAQADPLTL